MRCRRERASGQDASAHPPVQGQVGFVQGAMAGDRLSDRRSVRLPVVEGCGPLGVRQPGAGTGLPARSRASLDGGVVKLRVNPVSGQLAQWFDTDDDHPWLTANEVGLTSWLADADVADWLPVVLAPKNESPQFAFAVACATCDPHGVITDVHERDRIAEVHADHLPARFAVKLRHPGRAPDSRPPSFAAGASVTLHGSTTGGVAGLVRATVDEAAELPDEDGTLVSGYVVTVDYQSLFVPATALARA